MHALVHWLAAAVLLLGLGFLQVTGFLYLLSDTTRVSAMATLDRSAGFLLPVLPGMPRVQRPPGLPVDNATLDQVYAEAEAAARRADPSALLSQVGITLIPYADQPAVTISLVFYARPRGYEFDTYKGRVLEYRWTAGQGGQLLFAGDLREEKPELQAPFQAPPWRTHPRWPEFVARAVALSGLSRHPHSTLHLFQYGNEAAHDWRLLVHDGAAGADRLYFLRGNQILHRSDPNLLTDLELLARVFVSAEYRGPRQVLIENAGGQLLRQIEKKQFPDRIGPGTIHGVVLVPVAEGRIDAIVHLVGYDSAPYYERLRLERQPGGKWLVTALQRQFV